jgi:hypothetical protein
MSAKLTRQFHHCVSEVVYWCWTPLLNWIICKIILISRTNDKYTHCRKIQNNTNEKKLLRPFTPRTISSFQQSDIGKKRGVRHDNV